MSIRTRRGPIPAIVLFLLALALAADPALATAIPPNPTTPPVPIPTDPTTVPALPTTPQLLGAVVFMAVPLLGVIAGAWFLGVFRRDSIAGPARVMRDRPVWPVSVAAIGAVILWLAASVVAQLLVLGPDPAALDRAAEGALTEAETILVGLGGSLAPVVVLYPFIWWARKQSWGPRLGIGAGQIFPGLGVGLLGGVMIIIAVLFTTTLWQVIRSLLGQDLNERHPLLEILQEPGPNWLIPAAVLTAVVVAPLGEEILFRGLIQTAFSHGLPRLFGVGEPQSLPAEPLTASTAPGAPAPGWPAVSGSVSPLPEGPYQVPLDYSAPLPEGAEKAGPSAGWRWAGVILTSLLFMVVHPVFSWPAIFVLAALLGYLYERTGNLWACVVVHALFNGLATTITLLAM